MRKLSLALAILLISCGNLTPSGDITAVNTTGSSGLEGGSNVGSVSLSLLTSCADNEILKWDDGGSTWACAADDGGGGGVSDGNKGDVVVSSSGTVWTLDSTISIAGASNSTTFSALNAATGQTSDVAANFGYISGSFDATAAGRLAIGVSGNASPTKSAGSNTLTAWGVNGVAGGPNVNIGVRGQATSSATTNYAFLAIASTAGTNYSFYGQSGILNNQDAITEAGNRVYSIAGDGLTSSGATINVICTTNSLTCNANSVELASRDFGDITVGSTGTTMTIDNSTVTSAKLNITATTCTGTDKISAISATGVGTCTADQTGGGGGVSGSGTTGTIMKWTGTTAAGDSIITESGSIISVAGGVSASGNIQTTGSGAIGSNTSIVATTYMQGNGGVYAGSSSHTYMTNAGSGGFGCLYSTNGTGTCFINPVGYNEGTTQTRSLEIDDGTGTGAGNRIVFFDGATQLTTFYGNVTVNANSSVNGLSATNALTGQTTGNSGIRGDQTGSYNTTSGALISIGVRGEATSTRSAGANPLQNIGGYFTASGAQSNLAIYVPTGTVVFDGTLTSNGTVNLGDATSDQVTIAGDLTVEDVVLLNGSSQFGDADADIAVAWGKFGFRGTDPSVSSGNCTVAGEAQAFTITSSGGDMTSCVVLFNRTFSNPRCTFSPTTSGAAATIATPGMYITQTTTTVTLQHVSGNTAVGNSWNVHCLDDMD